MRTTQVIRDRDLHSAVIVTSEGGEAVELVFEHGAASLVFDRRAIPRIAEQLLTAAGYATGAGLIARLAENEERAAAGQGAHA